MRRFITLLLTLMLITPGVIGQLDTLTTCDPDTAFLNGDDLVDPLPFINDTLGEGFTRAACIGDTYEQVIFVKIPSIIPLGPAVLNVNSVRIDSVSNLPPGFAYVCSRPDCVFPTDTASCILLTGIAGENDTIGDYELKIGLTIGTFLGEIPVIIPDPALVNGTYILRVRASGDSTCLSAPVYDRNLEPLSYSAFPNPTQDEVVLEWESARSGSGWIEVKNITGQTLLREKTEFQQGLQQKTVSLSEFEPGIYLVGITSQHTVFWTKTLKQ